MFSIIVIFHLKNASDCHISEEPTNLLINFNIPYNNFLCIYSIHIELYNNGFGIYLLDMVELGFAEVLSLAQTIGIVGTMVFTLYFSKRQIQSLSIDTQTRVLNDLDKKTSQDGRTGRGRFNLGKSD